MTKSGFFQHMQDVSAEAFQQKRIQEGKSADKHRTEYAEKVQELIDRFRGEWQDRISSAAKDGKTETNIVNESSGAYHEAQKKVADIFSGEGFDVRLVRGNMRWTRHNSYNYNWLISWHKRFEEEA
jgi:hypothetical protein